MYPFILDHYPQFTIRNLLRTFYTLCLSLLIAGSIFTKTFAFSNKSNVNLANLTLEELMNIEVTSVSKKEQRLSDAAAAIFVITQEDIRRSGATSIQEALRMVPGLQVARINADGWAISSRGFNDYFANKLLVLIDGRSVYTPLFSGVFWEVQDIMMEDVERIEIIRGPGATLWGANAVNGIINIIMKDAEVTKGGLITAGAGTEEKGFGSLRYGSEIGEKTYYRVFAKYFDRDGSVDSSGNDMNNDWDMWHTGFRMDFKRTEYNEMLLEGDAYDGEIGENILVPVTRPPYYLESDTTVRVSGGNILGRWSRDFSASSGTTLQVYYDWYRRRHPGLYVEDRYTIDLDFQYRFLLGEVHDIIWGSGYRFTADEIDNSSVMSFEPAHKGDHLVSSFIQDEITLIRERLHFILGSKFEHNNYSGLEIQPNARLLWTPNSRNSVWMALSRAVRTPSRADHDISIDFDIIPPGNSMNPYPFPIILRALGSKDFDSEELLAYELGYRIQATRYLSMDIAAFYNRYNNLRSGESGAPVVKVSDIPPYIILPEIGANKMQGETYGAEFSVDWRVRDWWLIQTSYTFLQIQLKLDADRTDIWSESQEDMSPHHQVSLRSNIDLPKNLEFDLWTRYVDSIFFSNAGGVINNLSKPYISSYITLDLRLGWRPSEKLELSIAGQNLLDSRHPEFGKPFFINGVSGEIERSVYGKITWRI